MSDGHHGSPILTTEHHEGAIWEVTLNVPKGNILDADMIRALTAMFARASETPALKAILITGAGKHFSFGASVEEHRPGLVEEMLPVFHKLFLQMLDSSVFTVAAVRGQCLGGALELVSFCNRVFASSDARLGQPEIVLGVIAPVASLVLRERVGGPRAEDLCVSGRTLSAWEAREIGLIEEICEDPVSSALEYLETSFLQHSASSLRYAVRAARHDFAERFRTGIVAIEKLYLEDLMGTEDACEGIESFVEKRRPEWKNC